MATSSVDSTSALISQTAQAKKNATTAEAQQDRFLKLLVTQMKNQDPLNPLDNAEITSQMAQLSTVTGIEKLNATLAAMSQSQAYQAAALINHGVLAPGSFVDLSFDSAGNGAALAGVDLTTAAESVKVTITDSNGNVVRKLDLGKRDVGSSIFGWDGLTDAGAKAAAGTYKFTVQATQGGSAVAATSLAVGTVNSVLMNTAGPNLNVSGFGLVDLSEVRQIL
ncbi:MAG: flagellar hook assembly protein FlgD [Methylophilales bacterium]|nr:flagellar hook assembly protein FlgD [Methylophilales bacterium]